MAVQMAELYVKIKKPAAAEHTLHKRLARHPSDRQAEIALAILDLDERRYLEAAKRLIDNREAGLLVKHIALLSKAGDLSAA